MEWRLEIDSGASVKLLGLRMNLKNIFKIDVPFLADVQSCFHTRHIYKSETMQKMFHLSRIQVYCTLDDEDVLG